MPTSDLTASAWAFERKAEQDAAHNGEVLRAAARSCCEKLQAGPVTLLATSAEGVALAGAIVALRASPTHWRQVNLRAGSPVDGPVAVVEMVRLGEGLRQALLAQYPEAQILDGHAEPTGRKADPALRPAA
jgi:hypothetical protein